MHGWGQAEIALRPAWRLKDRARARTCYTHFFRALKWSDGFVGSGQFEGLNWWIQLQISRLKTMIVLVLKIE